MTESKPDLSERQREALVSLLADDDPEVYESMRQHILKMGRDSEKWLLPYTLSNDAAVRTRVREIFRHYKLRDADHDFLAFCLNRSRPLHLENGIWLLAKTSSPDMSIEGYAAVLDEYALRLQPPAGAMNSFPQVIEGLDQFVFGEMKFSRSDHAPTTAHVYMNRCMDGRKGSPLTLAILYRLLLGRLGVNADVAVNKGRYFVVMESPNGRHAMEPGSFVRSPDRSVLSETLLVLNERQLLWKCCALLLQAYRAADESEEARRILYYLAALADGIPREREL